MDSYALLDEYSPKHERLTPYAIPLSAAPEFTQSCNSDIERDCLRARNTSLLSVQKQLVEALEKIAEREAPDFDEDMTSYEKQIYWEARANWFQREARAAILAAKASS